MTKNTGAHRRRSWKKQFGFSTVTTLLTITVVELISWVAVSIFTKDGLARFRISQESLAMAGSSSDSRNETIHPYLGWVMNPQTGRGTDLGGRHIPINSLGFNDEGQVIPKRGPERLIIGVVGGSVAWQMTVLGETALRDVLQQTPAWRNKEIRIVRLAMPGYKQPQQLMALNYVLALGAEFDVIVNIDGYNEIALAACENDASGVFAAYPRMWHFRTQDLVDPRFYGVSYRLLQIRARRQELAQGIRRSWFRWSPTFNLIWKIRDQSCENQLVELASALQERKAAQDRGFASQGPTQIYDGDAAMVEHLCDLWKNSSLQIHHLCRGNGMTYLHVLQPNQYLAGSKPMSGREREKMIDEKQPYGQAVARSYPLLVRAGERLQEQGVDFHDLTMLFADTVEPIYADPYCHYNTQGNEMLARSIAGKIIDAFRTLE